MVHLKRTAINPRDPYGPPIVVIPRVSYQDAPSDLRRHVRHDTVEQQYGSARQEEADEENKRLDQESDEEHGNNLFSDHDREYEEYREKDYLVVGERYGHEDIAKEDWVDKRVQNQPQPQERSRWVLKLGSRRENVIYRESSPDVERRGLQQESSPIQPLRRTKPNMAMHRKDPISDIIVVNFSSESDDDVEMQNEPAQQRKLKPKQRKRMPAKMVEVVKDKYDAKDVQEKPKAVGSMAELSYEDEDSFDEPLPRTKREGGRPKKRNRSPYSPILDEVEAEHDMEYVEQRPDLSARKKALVFKADFSNEKESVEEKPAPKRKGGWPKGKKRGTSLPKPTALDVEAKDMAAELRRGANRQAKSRKRPVSQAMVEAAESHAEMIEPQPKYKFKPKPRKKTPPSKTEVELEDESDEPQCKTTPRKKARKPVISDPNVIDSALGNESEQVGESSKRLGYLKLPESEESEDFITSKRKSRSGASARGRIGGAAARARGNLTGQTVRTTVSRQTTMLEERGSSICEEEMARHGLKTERKHDELTMS